MVLDRAQRGRLGAAVVLAAGGGTAPGPGAAGGSSVGGVCVGILVCAAGGVLRADHGGAAAGAALVLAAGTYRTGKLKAIKSRQCWLLWASKAAVAAPGCAGRNNISPAEGQGDSIHSKMMEAQVGLGGSAGLFR